MSALANSGCMCIGLILEQKETKETKKIQSMASAGLCSLSGGIPSRAVMSVSAVSSAHSVTVRPMINSVSIDPQAIVGQHPNV